MAPAVGRNHHEKLNGVPGWFLASWLLGPVGNEIAAGESYDPGCGRTVSAKQESPRDGYGLGPRTLPPERKLERGCSVVVRAQRFPASSQQ